MAGLIPQEQAGARLDQPDDYAVRARRLGLPFVPEVQLDAGSRADVDAIKRGEFAKSPGSDGAAFIAPSEASMPDVLHWLAAHPGARRQLSVTTPTALREGLMQAGSRGFVEAAVQRLATRFPDLSARRIVTLAQVATGVVAVAGVAAALYVWPLPTLIAINLIGAFFFFGVSVLRFIAAGFAARRDLAKEVEDANGDDEEGDLPTYTILVPLLNEAALVEELVVALDGLDWPRDRLDIKLIVEADDAATLAAAHAVAGRPPYEVVVVPPAAPRTKPKALAYALPFARGDYVTVYDAEDHPHPRQLREAHAVFARSEPDLACLQAPLLVDNGSASLLARLFAIEYAALFDGLLPTLAALGMPLPLGGTSNHFRRDVLEEVGGWDPYNVTEDADMGVRLARFGYRTATITLPTFEEAPATLWPWIKQRTRWFKGWMQTWLVHTRRPWRLARELGWRGLLGFNLFGTGLIVSALVHPIYLVTVFAVVTDPLDLWGDGGAFASMVVGLNLFNLFAGYTAMAALGLRTLELRGRERDGRALVLLPVYWLVMSFASYRALFHLLIKPHRWEKTPHRGRRERTPRPKAIRAPRRSEGNSG